jgi:hypothetical protein
MAAHKEYEWKDTTPARPAPVAERPPPSLFLIALGLCIWLAVPLIIILGTTLQGRLVFAVCLVFSLRARNGRLRYVGLDLSTAISGSFEWSSRRGNMTTPSPV